MTVVSGQLSLAGDNMGAKLMSGKIFVWLVATVLLTTAPPAEAQQPKKVPVIGYLSANDPASESARSEAIRLALREQWLHRRTEHRHRVPICGGEARSVP